MIETNGNTNNARSGEYIQGDNIPKRTIYGGDKVTIQFLTITIKTKQIINSPEIYIEMVLINSG